MSTELLFRKSREEINRVWNELEDEVLEAFYDEEERQRIAQRRKDFAKCLLTKIVYYMKGLHEDFQNTLFALECLHMIMKTKEHYFLDFYIGNTSDELDELTKDEYCMVVPLAGKYLIYYDHLYEAGKRNSSVNTIVKAKYEELVRDSGEKKYLNSSQLPMRLKEHLDEWVIGQEKLKQSLAMKLYRFIRYGERSAMLMIGPTGSGKNFILEAVSKFDFGNNIKIKFFVEDASALTSEGFKGRNLSDLFSDISSFLNPGVLGKAREDCFVIVYLDEIDKLLIPNWSQDENVSVHVQHQLLSALAGTFVRKVDTSKILFILGGAFGELNKIEKEKEKHKIGFQMAEEEDSFDLETSLRENLIAMGAERELIGRIRTIVRMEKLTKEELKKVLLYDKGVLKNKQSEYAKDGISMEVVPEVLDWLANKAYEQCLGARAVANILEELLSKYDYTMFEKGYNKVIFHEGVIKGEVPRFEK